MNNKKNLNNMLEQPDLFTIITYLELLKDMKNTIRTFPTLKQIKILHG